MIIQCVFLETQRNVSACAPIAIELIIYAQMVGERLHKYQPKTDRICKRNEQFTFLYIILQVL